MKIKNVGEKFEYGDLVKFVRQYGKTRMLIYKLLGIPIKMRKVLISDEN